MNLDNGKCQTFPVTLQKIQFTKTYDKKKDEEENMS